MDPLVEQLMQDVRDTFGPDQKRIDHAWAVLGFANQIRAVEGGDPLVIQAAALLHDIGIQEAERKYGSAGGRYQEIEGPPIAERILRRRKVEEERLRHVCRIVANHHSARDIDTLEFRVLWDADWLVNWPEMGGNLSGPALVARIQKIFKTNAGRETAWRLFVDPQSKTCIAKELDRMDMMCFQCEQTAKGTGCLVQGVCGKDARTAALQDLLVYAVKDIARYAHRAAQLGTRDRDVDVFVVKALFSTLTNVNFDPQRFVGYLNEAARMKERAQKVYEKAAIKAGQTLERLDCPVRWWEGHSDIETLVRKSREVGIDKRTAQLGATVAGVQELIMYGLKGVAAYTDHAQILGQEDEQLYAAIHEMLNYLTGKPTDANELLGRALKTGEINLKAMELLDAANTGVYGHPEPTQVRVTPVKGKCILVSGHDLKDLEELLKQTQGKGINVYTHGEMLPCNAYPALKKYKHLVGNYGGAWQDQRSEFEAFPGAIVMTTNCLQKPKDSYRNRIFTLGLVGWPDVAHISDGDFTPAIEAALAAPGFDADAPAKFITVGFGRNTVMSVAGPVIDLVKQGKIRHFYLIGGCDGAKPGRNYYTEFAEQVPSDCVILTLACGKYRFNKLDFGQIEGIPRLLDVGQCNDAYSAVQIAVALAGAFGVGVNDLPLSLILSWFEQKAVAILLTLLYLGIKDIRIGPSLPAFVTPEVLGVLVDKFAIKPISTASADLAATLARK